MRTFLISIICCILCSINISAQENVIFDLSGKPVVFQDRNSLELQGSLTGQTYIRFRALLNEDVFSYYDIEGYETALLKEEFLNSQKGKELARQLSELKKIICSDDIYYIYTFRSNRGYKKEYNLKTGKFDLEYVVDDRQFVPIAGYINFPYCVLKTSKIRQSVSQHEWYNYPGRYSYHTTISIPMPKTVALIVEKNIDDAALVVSFNSPRTKSTRWFTTVTGVATNFMIINIKTNEIYYSLDKNKLKELQIKQEREQQVKLAQERELQRQIVEQQRKEREEAERRALERRAKIETFLTERTDTTYSIETENSLKYKQDKASLSQTLAEAIEQFNPQNLDLTVTDSVYIDYMGNIKHSIAVSGTSEISGLEDAVRKQMEQCRISPMSIKVPGTDTTCTVTSADFYLLDYRIFTESSALNLKKTKSAVSVKSGDRQFYQKNKSGIDTYLSKGNGIYKVDATVKTTNGKRDTDVSINKFRNINPAYTIGYHYTPFAPVGFVFGINNIKNSNWGAFIKLGGKTASSPEGDIYEVPEYSNKYVGGFYLTLGTTCSISKYGYLYAGIGGANRADKNVWQEGSTIHRDVRNTGGFNVEAGVVIRPVKWVGVSVGYNYIAGKSSYGGINIGAVFFLQKGDFR
jgi:hypothetical protein